jgi:hypothetical protein
MIKINKQTAIVATVAATLSGVITYTFAKNTYQEQYYKAKIEDIEVRKANTIKPEVNSQKIIIGDERVF